MICGCSVLRLAWTPPPRASRWGELHDTGCGIPSSELTKVVGFGQRGSNVQHRRTMGGGFGLTKAFLVTKRFGGRMWIRSQEGVGTRITLQIPLPTSRAAATVEPVGQRA
ncbi:ATP-binding protein [Thermosynechococcaceae cyanobacterium Okahandja]